MNRRSFLKAGAGIVGAIGAIAVAPKVKAKLLTATEILRREEVLDNALSSSFEEMCSYSYWEETWDGHWHHYVVTENGNIFIDGKLKNGEMLR